MAICNPPGPPKQVEGRSAEPVQTSVDLDRFVPALLDHIANRFNATVSRDGRQAFGIVAAEGRILLMLGAEPNIPAARICQVTGVDKGAVSHTIKTLIARGYVQTRADERDRRIAVLALTSQGEALTAAMLKTSFAREARLLTGFSDEERELLIALLCRVRDNVPLASGPEQSASS